MFKKLAVVACCFALTGCGMNIRGCGSQYPPENPKPHKPFVWEVDRSDSFAYLDKMQVTENLPVKVYVDGTASMAGYTNKNQPSVFKDIIKSIEPIFHARWKSNKIEFVRFGDSYVSFDGEKFLNFEKEDFYKDIDTRLDNVIKDTDNKKLSIIITDLYQTNQHYTSLSNALQNKCFGNQSDRGFAIIGVKSQFNGKIYDVAGHTQPIEYVSIDNNVDSYRPVYLLVVGKDEDVKIFSKEFKSKFEDAKISLFTNDYSYANTLSLPDDFGKGPFINKGDKDGRAQNKLIYLKLKAGEKVKESLILEGKGSPVEIPNKYNITINDLKKWNEGSKIPFIGGTGSFSDVNNPGLVTGTADLIINGSNIKSALKFDINATKENAGKYRIGFSLYPTREDYINHQDVFKAWNFDENRVPPNDNEIGKRTQSISAFTKLVADKHYMQDKPGIKNAEFYLDIE